MKKKNVVDLMGGLGNQLFQYAFALYLGNDTILNSSFYDNDFQRKLLLCYYDIDLPVKSINACDEEDLVSVVKRKLARIPSESFREKESFCFEETIKQGCWYTGYWQNENYITTLLKRGLECKKVLSPEAVDYIKVVTDDSDSVAIHIRRGDYLSEKNKQLYSIQCLEYYYKACERLENIKGHSLHYYIFSDDIDWCKENFSDDYKFVSVVGADTDIDEFEIMRRCKHFIISNSTYSWWAAKLGKNSDKTIIAPYKWYVDEGLNVKSRKALLSKTLIIDA